MKSFNAEKEFNLMLLEIVQMARECVEIQEFVKEVNRMCDAACFKWWELN